MSRRAWLAAWIAVVVAWRGVPAGAAKPVRVHALTGVRIVVSPGRVIDDGTVVLRDGLIVAAGAGVAVPADARVWEGKGLTVYAGLVDPYTVRALAEPKDGDKQATWADENALVRPERDILPWLADAAAAKKLRDAGFTTAAVAAKDGLFRGQSVVLDLGESAPQASLLRAGFAQNVTVRPSGQRRDEDAYPASLMGAVALFRQTMYDAGWYAKAKAAYGKNARQERPQWNAALEALQPAASGSQLVVFETDDVLDTLRDAKLAKEFKLRAAVVGNGEEYKRLADVKATGLPILLPLNFPKAPALDGPSDPNVDLEDLRHWDAAPSNPKKVLDAGLDVAFTSFGLDDPKKLYANLARAMQRGLTADQALAALTTAPAKFLGVQDRVGTVEVGKLANLVVVDGDLFVEKPKIREVWVEGDRFEVKESKAAEVEPAGTWELNVKTDDGQDLPSTLELTGKAEALKGKLSAMGKTLDVDVSVSGSKVEVAFDGAGLGFPGAITLSLDVQGDTATGSGHGPGGAFTITGTRTAKPSGPKLSFEGEVAR